VCDPRRVQLLCRTCHNTKTERQSGAHRHRHTGTSTGSAPPAPALAASTGTSTLGGTIAPTPAPAPGRTPGAHDRRTVTAPSAHGSSSTSTHGPVRVTPRRRPTRPRRRWCAPCRRTGGGG
jgi:hypothetical protein